MVLWELTLATAYFLGLRRTYRLALRIQKRVIGPKHPKIRQFVHRRVRSVFDMAVRVHKNIQERDIEVGRNLGNRILRWLDKMKPSAEIRRSPTNPSSKINNSNIIKQTPNTAQQTHRVNSKLSEQKPKGKLFFSPLNIRQRSFPSIAVMMQPMRSAGMNGHYRQFSQFTPAAPALGYRIGKSEGGVFRKDIAMLMMSS
ncbi:uncharacterized protein A4U43_C04F11930 [Asparagus officinalis]|uniref:Uncharacterized protein n=1 Tax=Asparagus officinalis TaxID=4686 RepID=A0A5P1F073_ASPOF|nr:uncharacterized protein LOC109837121 [Asparagus officinalis]ONK71745.1 uncharacterized protein A4U43_C04F11930 [Asparagus officinalis]